MGFLTKEGLQYLTNKLVQGDAIKVASHRGKNVKEIIDNIQRECENVALPNTMTLENRVNEFKVGQGRDVDVSGDVEEGKINVELQGKTYQNLCRSNAGVSIQYIADYEIKDRANYLEVTRIAENNNGWGYFSNKTLKLSMLKPNTTYTVFFKYESTCNNMPRLQIQQGTALESISDPTSSVSLANNIYRCVIKTSSSFEGKKIGGQVIYFHNSQPKKVGDTVILYKNMLFLEGDHSDLSVEELPKYFDGIKSSFEDGVVNINIQGKNLFDFNNKSISSTTGVTYNKIGNKFELSSDSTSKAFANTTISFPAELFEGKTVALSCKSIQTNTSANPTVQIYYIDANHQNRYIGFWNRTTIHTFPDKINSDHVKLGLYPNSKDTSAIVNTIHVEDIMAEESEVKTDYEEAYNYSYKFNIKEPLRSLPNGVCDEIRNNNGQWELVRKIGKVILDGSEPWLIAVGDNNNTMYWNVDNIGNAKTYVTPGIIPNLICDKIGITSYNTAFNMDKDSTMMCLTNRNKSTTNSIAIRMLNPNNHTGVLSEWLSENPTTVYYELAKPIITPIDPIEFDISQGAVININSDISPASTHEVILNRAGQIEQGIELIANLKSRVNDLENIYDSNLITTQYRLNNLKLNYELEREED